MVRGFVTRRWCRRGYWRCCCVGEGVSVVGGRGCLWACFGGGWRRRRFEEGGGPGEDRLLPPQGRHAGGEPGRVQKEDATGHWSLREGIWILREARGGTESRMDVPLYGYYPVSESLAWIWSIWKKEATRWVLGAGEEGPEDLLGYGSQAGIWEDVQRALAGFLDQSLLWMGQRGQKEALWRRDSLGRKSGRGTIRTRWPLWDYEYHFKFGR